MPAKTIIVDPKTGISARVTEFGQLVTAPLNFSTPVSVEVDDINTAFLLVSPEDGKNIIVDSIVITGNRDIGVNDATVVIYSATSEDDINPVAAEVSLEIAKNSNIPLTGLNFIIPEGRFFLAKTNDATVFITIGYYYAPID